ncbi:YadA-like family protein [Burkholderia sp. AU39826]|uniref:ESPR-type extended signal peptide-containing protein n=1 Tax=Burkholderia sp. AU39826 TaxID=2879634 RepID=UPI001CF5E934|nr:ESPR-type extended signal peptide-containing protein [Burkholderia sp. AU39826]MCA7970315.1 YadA-like family protein [Burkholderia sp. AU39826]
MNKTYRSIWNAATSTWTAVAETAKSHSKGSSRAARQAVIAITLGTAAIGSAAAAEACTTADGSSGTVDDAGVCQAVNQSEIGTMGSIGTMAGGWSSGNGISIWTGSGTAANAATASDISIGNGSSALGGTSTALGNGATAGTTAGTAIGANATSTASYGLAIGAATQVGRGAVVEATGSVAIGTISHVTSGASSAVALGMGSVAHEANTVSVGAGIPNIDGQTFTRRIVNVSAGTADNDAVNLGQLNTGLSTTNASIERTNTALSTTNATLSTTNASLSTTNVALSTTNANLSTTTASLSTTNSTLSTTNVQLAGLDSDMKVAKGDIETINDQLAGLSGGTIGLVQQAAAGADLTVGANTDGDTVNFTGTAGTRTLTGVTAGDVSTASTDAVNGSQLHGVADSVASAIGGGSTVNADGSISAPSFTVGDGSGGTKVVNSVGDVVTNLDGRTTTNEGDIKKLADEIGSGTVGLVQQANPGDDITVGANTDGAAVNFAGTAGNRKLTGIAAGDVSAASSEAVNGSQLHGVADSVASAIGGGSTVNADGSISAPSFTVGDGSGGTKIVNSVGDAVTNLDGRVTDNEGGIKKLADQLGSGTVGLVRQDATSGMITVGAGGAGSVVNFAGSGGPRVLSGVANGVNDDDVVTVSQLRATGLIDYTGKEVGAVTYDSGLSFDSVTFAGTDGTVLRQVAAGQISATSMEAVNGGQLYALQEQFAKQYGDLSGRFDDLSSRVGELETNPGDPGTGGPGAGGPGTGEGSTVVGEGSNASGKNSSAIGNGSVASGENSSAVGQGSVASGKDSTAVGQGSVASGDGSTALGQGASATGSNSVAIGQGSVATEANTVSFGDGTAEGNRRLVNIADGINASDAATKGQLDRAMESVDQRFNDTNRAINDVAKNAYAGIAAAMAMPNMTPSQPGKTVVAVGAANFKSGSAIAAGATYRSRNGNWLVNGATSVTSVGDVGVRAQVGYEF